MTNEQLKLAEKHFGKYVYEARGIFDAFTTELLAGISPAPLAGSDAVDAARYRWLRERNAVLDNCPIFTAIRTAGPDGKFAGNDLIALDEMDAAIDEFRAALSQGDVSGEGEGS
jgi:hypothetical protein